MRRVVIGRRSRHACRHSKPNPNLSKRTCIMHARSGLYCTGMAGSWVGRGVCVCSALAALFFQSSLRFMPPSRTILVPQSSNTTVPALTSPYSSRI